MKKMSPFTSLLCWLTGTDMQTLERAGSTEITSLSITGSIILITPIMGTVTGTFAVLTFTNDLRIAVAVGALWGLVILLLERSVVANAKPNSLSFMLIGRVMLAIVFALVVSKPAEIAIFGDAIQERLNRNLGTAKSLIDDEANEQIAEYRNQITQERNRSKASRARYLAEIDGGGGSGQIGLGPIAQNKLRAYHIDSVEAAEAIHEHAQGIARIDEQRKQDIQHLTANQAHGLLGQLRVLSALSDEDPTVRWSMYVIALLFFLIELLPLLTKMSSDGGLLYQQIWQSTRDNKLKAIKQQAEGDLQVAIQQSKLDTDRALHHIQIHSLKLVTSQAEEAFSVISEQMQRAANRKMAMEKEILESIADEKIRIQMLDNVNVVYNNFMLKIKQLLAESDSTTPFTPNF
jgi:hypothetical protein